MSDRIIRESWAIICEDGSVAGHCEEVPELDSFPNQASAEAFMLERQDCLIGWNECESFRVARVRLSEVMEDGIDVEVREEVGNHADV